ncbi:ABC transporter substrate-binding protein [Streptomyces californicus]
MRIAQDFAPRATGGPAGPDAGRTARRRPARGRAVAALTAAVAFALVLSGCGQGAEPAPKPASAKGSAEADRVEPLAAAPAPKLPVTVDSADGTKVTIDSTDRIVPLTGSLSEIVFTLGFDRQVVARGDHRHLRTGGEAPGGDPGPSTCRRRACSPAGRTIVLADTTTGPSEAIDQIRDAGIPLLGRRARQGAGRRRPPDRHRRRGARRAVGGRRAEGRTEDRIAAVQKSIPAAPDGRKPRVAFLYLRGSAAVYLLGGAESGAGSLLEAAGAVDAGKESGLKKDFTAITSEALAKAAPDAILLMTKGFESVGGMEGLVKIPGIAETPAGMDRRVVTVDDGMLLNYGPRTDRVLTEIVEQLYAKGGEGR